MDNSERIPESLEKIIRVASDLLGNNIPEFEVYTNLRAMALQFLDKDLQSTKPVFLGLISRNFEQLQNAGFIHESYITNFYNSLILKHYENLTGENCAALYKQIDSHIKPKTKEDQKNTLRTLVKGILVFRLHENGASFNQSFRIVGDMFAASESDVVRCYDYLLKSAFPEILYRNPVLAGIILTAVLLRGKKWRVPDSDLEKFNKNSREAIEISYSAYDKLKVDTANSLLSRISAHIVSSEDVFIRKLISLEQQAKYKTPIVSIDEKEVAILTIIFIHLFIMPLDSAISVENSKLRGWVQTV